MKESARVLETEVLIVGAGPVGLTLAVALGQRGVRCILVERKPAPQFLPKMERCNARTMEIFRADGRLHRARAEPAAARAPSLSVGGRGTARDRQPASG
jgi:2-polyprenyl-6-methoxyphenol hydroxylase-like FAD-dependent oxidoreductase